MKLKIQVWIHHQGDVLLLKTNAARGGFWQPVTGSVEKGEELPAAALREATEETRLEFRGQPKRLGEPFCFENHGKQCEETGFSLEAESREVTTDPREHDGFRWVSPKEARKLLKFDSNRDLLEELVAGWISK
jgi:8-oxo-dGTP pyrophosphatase MutT (NUDIX family)